MLRIIQAATTIGVLGSLAVVVGLTWRDQCRLARRLEEVSAGLDALAGQATAVAEAAGRAPAPEPDVPSAVSLHGFAYFDDASRPAADFPLTIRAMDGEYVREATTDAAGRFDSGDLPPGKYQATFCPVDEEGEPSSGLFVFFSEEFDLSQRGARGETAWNVRQLDASVRVKFDSSPPVVVMRGERYQLLPHAYLVTFGGASERTADDGSPPSGPLARPGGRLEGFSHFLWNHPLGASKKAEVKPHLEYLEGASTIASGVVRLDAYALSPRPSSIHSRGNQELATPLFRETAIETVEIVPGEHVSIEIGGLDKESLLLPEEERRPDRSFANRTSAGEEDFTERQRRQFGIRPLTSKSFQVVVRRED